jgi:hypothetical protein
MAAAAGFGWRPVAARIYVGSERMEIISDFSLPRAENIISAPHGA